jgi:DinB superfamily
MPVDSVTAAGPTIDMSRGGQEMRYESLTRVERETLLNDLDGMAVYLAGRFGALPNDRATLPPTGGGFSPVEQCWHLADLEREGFGLRIRRLLAETDPVLPDFDGDRAAVVRQYKRRSMEEGIRAFREARAENLALIRSIASADWSRSGTQEGVGRIALCDMPNMMFQHDRAHRGEIEAWFAQR